MSAGKLRLDVRVVEEGLAPSRERAQALIIAGQILVNDEPMTKPGHSIPANAVLRLRGEAIPYVSRGGLKLVHALDQFKISAEGRTALDVGASTGGFTDVLLQRGALKVHAVDAGHNQLDWKIRTDPRVRVLEKTNARYLEFATLGETVGIIVIDVSFISLEKVLPALVVFSTPETDWITLIKPQFEVGRGKVGKGGIVNNADDHVAVIARLETFGKEIGLARLGLVGSPITGTRGNKEFLAHWRLARDL